VDLRNVWAGLGVWIGNRSLDTQLLAKMVNPDERGRANLKSLVEEYFPDGHVLVDAEKALDDVAHDLAPKHHRVGPAFKRFKWGCLPTTNHEYLWYAGLDAIFVRRLVHPLLYALYGQRNVILQDHALYAIVQAASIRGIHLDVAACRRILAEYEEKIQEGDETVREVLGFPARSPKLADWVDQNVSETQGMDRSQKTGRLTLDNKALPKILALDLPETVREVLEAREAVASASNTRANLNGFLKAESDGMIHPDVKILQARTARWSITNPALQTLKKSETTLG
jgi:DNA polymerase-1